MKNLKMYRLKHNLSQAELSKDLNISQSSIHCYENNTKEASYKTVVKIADYFNVSIEELLGVEDNSGITYPQRYIEVDESEKELINNYRRLSKQRQAEILQIIKVYKIIENQTK